MCRSPDIAASRPRLIDRETSVTDARVARDRTLTRRGADPIFAEIRYEDDSGPQSYFVTQNEISIGRGGQDLSVDLPLYTNDEVSREHLRLRRDPATGRFTVSDNSRNGTWLNGRKLARGTEEPLPDRARIQVADVITLSFEVKKCMSSSYTCLAFACASVARRGGAMAERSWHRSGNIRLRASNEDRYWIDDENGVFLVVDGVGGHAAGETAAETAVEAIREELRRGERCEGGAEERVRRAIAAANNRIFAMAQDSDELRGMACVLTLALVDAERDGDRPRGRFAALPDLERRDPQADLGSFAGRRRGRCRRVDRRTGHAAPAAQRGFPRCGHAAARGGRRWLHRDPPLPFQAGGGVSAVQRRAERRAALGCHPGRSWSATRATPAQVARELVEAANEAGGKDNITALFVAGSEFRRDAGGKRARGTPPRACARPLAAARGPAAMLPGASLSCSMACCWECCYAAALASR